MPSRFHHSFKFVLAIFIQTLQGQRTCCNVSSIKCVAVYLPTSYIGLSTARTEVHLLDKYGGDKRRTGTVIYNALARVNMKLIGYEIYTACSRPIQVQPD